jgi:hypothetical protein
MALLLPSPLLAQDVTSTNSIDSIPAKLSFFKITSAYLSNAVYSGRKDSARVPYLKAAIAYIDKSGFHAEVETDALASSAEAKRLDLVTVGAGYSFKLSKKLEGEVSASKFFYTDASFAVQSELKAMTGLSLGYDADIFALNTGIDLMLSNATDVIANVKISHYFEKGPASHLWTITPAFELNAGTQHFNQAYYAKRKFSFATTGTSGSGSSNHGKGHSASTGTGNSKTLAFTEENKFTILDYEISAPLTFETKHFGAFFTPTYAIPTHPAEYLLDNALEKEKLSNSFFIEVGAFVKLNVHHRKA